MVALAILAIGLLVCAVLAVNAWLLSIAIPALVADPANVWAWLLLVSVIFALLRMTRDLPTGKNRDSD